jgi:GH25 family lysozyme M1 (1,4-beta-N-acetylmuramidase)/uncharacterized protein with LGFP repeats
MDAAKNHTMGSTIAAAEGTTRFRTFAAAAPGISVDGVLGQDVSGWQESVDWGAQWAAGSRFAYVKATEGTYYTSGWFSSQYAGAYNVGMIRGAYHFAAPNTTDGATQARFFYQHGGGWAPDGRTLPPLLDIEYGTDGTGTCWGLSQAAMSQWIADFVTTLRSLTGVNPAIYSTANWWNTCTGSNSTFGAYPLFVARYGTSTPGTLPAGWPTWSIWQFADSGTFAGDQDVFNGSQEQLRQFALGSPGPTAIAQKYAAMGGSSGVLGAIASPVTWISQNGGGFGQAYANGSIYWTLSSGAHVVLAGALRDFYFASSGAAGGYGWPLSDTEAVGANGGGYQQAFTAGAIYSSPAGTYLVSGSTRLGYFARDGAMGPLGWPTAARDCGLASGGCVQTFQNGVVYTDRSGAWFTVQGAIYAPYAAAGGVTGSWGYPTTNAIDIASASGNGSGQAFTGGSAYVRPGSSAFFVSGGVRDFYFSKGGATGSLGWPAGTSSCTTTSSSCTQLFTGGTVTWTSAKGGTVTAPQIDAAYAAAGGSGTLGAAQSDLIWVPQNGGGLGKAYANGSIYWTTATGAYPVSGGIRTVYFGVSGSAGPLGWPTSGPVCTFSGGGCSQPFQNAAIIAGRASSGYYTVTGAYLTALIAAGGTTGTLGLPTSAVLAISSNGGGTGQVFDGGSIFSSAAGTYAVSGGIRTFYFARNGAAGAVGWPAGPMACSNGTCTQKFTGGTISWSAATGGTLTP